MNIELFKLVGEAAYGSSWKSSIQRDLGLNHRQRITQWLESTRPIPNLTSELLAILNIRKAQIDNAIKALSNEFYIEPKQDLSKIVTTISDNGELLPYVFESIELAKTWANENLDMEGEGYLVKFNTMTLREFSCYLLIQEFHDIADPSNVLKKIQSNVYDNEFIFEQLAQIYDEVFGQEYYAYLIKNELFIGYEGGYEDEPSKTITYKQFVINKIAKLLEAAANVV